MSSFDPLSLLGQGLSSAASIYNNERMMHFNEQEAEKQRLFNSEEAQKDRDFQQEMWNQENAYNTPAAQMARARAAGLNPSLLYGQPIAESAAAPSGSTASSGIASSPNLSNPFANLGQYLADVKLKESQARYYDEQATTEDAKRQALIDNLNSATAANLANVQDIASKIRQRDFQNKLTEAQINDISFEQMFKTRKLDIDYQRLKNETHMTDAQIDLMKSQKEKALADARVTNRQYDEMVYTFAIRKLGLEKKVQLDDAMIRQADATAQKLGMDTRQIEQMININSPDEFYSKGMSDSMSGKNGVVNQMGSQIWYSVDHVLDKISFGLLGKF